MSSESATVTAARRQGSSSIEQKDYWWYRARADLLQAALEPHLGDPRRVLDVGSADGPSVGWMRGTRRVEIDVDPRGLSPSAGVCGSALALPFADETFDVVSAFDVLEHCEPESTAMNEFNRVLGVGGRLLMSVPAYEWAWTDHDVRAGHYRRYTRARLLRAVQRTGLCVERSSYAFAGVFPFFAAERLARRIRRSDGVEDGSLPTVSPLAERILMALSAGDALALRRGLYLPFGSSILVAAVKTAR